MLARGGLQLHEEYISSDGGGLVIGYATAPGDVAADGDGFNSPFTTALLKRLPTKGIELELLL